MTRSMFSRRALFAGALGALPLARRLEAVSPEFPEARAETIVKMRQGAALTHGKRAVSKTSANGDESRLPACTGCYTKGLPRNQQGEVEQAAYDALLAALSSRKHADFERIPRGAGRKLINPQSAFTFQFEGGDSHTFDTPAAPAVSSEAAAWEASELYWQALARDVPFREFDSSPVIRRAANDLGTTTMRVFRGPSKGDLQGPYVSQFLLKPIPYGSAKVDQRYATTLPGSDFMTAVTEWSQIQAGMPPWREAPYDRERRYIRTGRDLAEYVHYDFTNQAFLAAALILINAGPKSLLNCNQFKSASNPYRYSTIQDGFVTFGQAETLDWLGRVTSSALKATWYHKWCVHRRLRPEELGGLIHRTRQDEGRSPFHASLDRSSAVDAVHAQTGTYLLPQSYPEGCPLHPAYPSGHAAIAGACSVVLKVCFDGSMLLPGCVEPSADGLSLVPLAGYSPTIGDEIDKLAFNIGMGRNWAGIHYRTDATSGIRLGEDVAISILQDLACTYTEDFKGFAFKRFDGSHIEITPRGEVIES